MKSLELDIWAFEKEPTNGLSIAATHLTKGVIGEEHKEILGLYCRGGDGVWILGKKYA